MDEGTVLALITACGPRLGLHMKPPGPIPHQLDQNLWDRGPDMNIKKKKNSPRDETPGGQEC